MIKRAFEIAEKAEKQIPENDKMARIRKVMAKKYLDVTVENIRTLRFAYDGYIWINEIEPPYTVVMHAISPHMEGTAQYFYIKETQQNVYEAFADVIHENKGEGFLQYDFYKPGSEERIPKLSFIKLYEPLGWVIGTGVYIDYIDKMVAGKTKQLNRQTNSMILYIIVLSTILVAITIIMLYILGKTITNAIKNVNVQLEKMSKGYSVKVNTDNRKDEIGDMIKSLNALIDGIAKYTQFTKQIEKGNLYSEFSPLSQDDTFGNSLISMRNSLQKAEEEANIRREENKKQNWANEGYTKFSELTRNNKGTFTELSFTIISQMVDYINAVQGGIFVYNDSNPKKPMIEMVASIAYQRRKFIEKNISPGDGLIGACFLEKKKIYITKIPEEYTEITSGLGTANPNALLILPLMIEDTVIGIIELMSFREFQDYEIEFAEKVSKTIAASIYAAKTTQMTQNFEINYEKIITKNKKLKEKLNQKETEIKKLNDQIDQLKQQQNLLVFGN